MNTLSENKKLAIFDLDGTLVDTLFDVTSSINMALVKLNLKEVDSDFVKNYLGFGGSYLVKAAIEKSQKSTEELIQKVSDLYMHYYNQEMLKKSCLYKGVIETLDKLINSNFIIVLCTNKITKFTFPLLEYLKIKKYFNLIICGDTYPLKKPSPYPLLQILAFFQLEPDMAIYIGDTNIDKMAAENANIQFIYAAYGYGNLNYNERLTISNINDFIVK